MGGEGESCNQTQGGGGTVTNFRLGDVARRGSSPAERGNHVTGHKEARSFAGPAPAAKGTPRARGMIGQIHVMSLHPDKSFVTLVWAPFGTGNWLRTASEAMGSTTTGIVSWLGTALRNQFPDPFFCGGIDFRSSFENILLV